MPRATLNTIVKATLQPLLVAFSDTLGPLPRMPRGKYLLTVMCLFSKYPEAIPLKKVDTICHYVKVTKSHCKALNIKQVWISPCLEKWHACLKWIIEKAQINEREWETYYLQCLLFPYIDTLHVFPGCSF